MDFQQIRCVIQQGLYLRYEGQLFFGGLSFEVVNEFWSYYLGKELMVAINMSRIFLKELTTLAGLK